MFKYVTCLNNNELCLYLSIKKGLFKELKLNTSRNLYMFKRQ